jgi:hypothetical protein
VRRVGEERERVDEDSDDYLDRHEADDQSERDGQTLRVSIRGYRMRV